MTPPTTSLLRQLHTWAKTTASTCHICQQDTARGRRRSKHKTLSKHNIHYTATNFSTTSSSPATNSQQSSQTPRQTSSLVGSLTQTTTQPFTGQQPWVTLMSSNS